MTASTRRRQPRPEGQAMVTCLILLLGSRAQAFLGSPSMATRISTSRRASISPVHMEPVLPAEDCAGHQRDQGFQDFQGPFPPVHRPLTLRQDVSEANRGLYIFEQPLHTIPTVRMFNRQAVYALNDGSLILYNPIAPTEETLREIKDAFGSPDHIIVPTTAYNNLVYVRGWAERFPRATFWGLDGVKLPGAKRTKTLTLESFPQSWKSELDLSILEGNRMFRECFLLHRTTRSVFAMDSLVEMGQENIPHPWLQAGSRMTGNFGRPVCPTKSLLWNRERCKAAISKVLDWDFDTVYATHGECPIYDAKRAIRDEFKFLWD